MKNMRYLFKSFILMLICFCLVLGAVACGDKEGGKPSSGSGLATIFGGGNSKNESSESGSGGASAENGKDKGNTGKDKGNNNKDPNNNGKDDNSSKVSNNSSKNPNKNDKDSNDSNQDSNGNGNAPNQNNKEEEKMGYTYKHVIVIGVDGAGNFFKNANTPNIDKIFKNGAITYNALTENPSISAQSWGSLLHGVTNDMHGVTNASAAASPYPVDSKFPSFFKVVSENDENAKMGAFSNWWPINTGIIEDIYGLYKFHDAPDAEIAADTCWYVAEKAPKLVFVQFDEADAAGHNSGYNTPKQHEKITEIDGYIGKIYEAYEKKGIIDDTLFIVTADHGGNGGGHGGYTDGEKYIMFAAAGKTVEKGTIGDMAIRDTASIVLHAFGYKQPETWTSRVPSGLFKGVTAGPRPVYVDESSNRYHETVPTPLKGSSGYITNFISTPLKYYLPFDGGINDVCNNQTSSGGKLYFVDGYFGKGVSLDDGYVSIKNYAPKNDSFTVGMWVKTNGVTSDPVLFSNKNWVNGNNTGFVLSLLNSNEVKFNFGNGSSRMDLVVPLPSNYKTGWMYVLTVVDRQNAEIRVSVDFGDFVTLKIPDALKNSSANAFNVLNIGQDGTGSYTEALAATIDEFMLFSGALTKNDVNKLKQYYGQ